MNFIREIIALFRYLFTVPAADKRVVIYAEHAGYYPNFEGLIHTLNERYQQKVIYLTSDPSDPILERNDAGLRAFYLATLLPFLMMMIKCDVFIMTLTELDNYHLKRSTHPVHYVYVFHSMVSTHMMYAAGSFDHYDSILCVGPYMEDELRAAEELAKLPAKQLIMSGYYRLERIRSAFAQRQRAASEPATPEPATPEPATPEPATPEPATPEPATPEPATPESGRATAGETVLIAPSWGKDNVLETCGEALVEALLADGYEVIVRPHPETVRRSPALLRALDSAFGRREAFTLELSVATDDSLLRADLLVCDGSGVALEYAFGTERPVLFLDVPLKVKNPAFGELGREPIEVATRTELGALVAADDMDVIRAEVRRLLDSADAYRVAICARRDALVFDDEPSSEVGARHVMQLLG